MEYLLRIMHYEACVSYVDRYVVNMWRKCMHVIRPLLCFVVVSYWSIWPITFRVTSLALWHPYACSSTNEATLYNAGKKLHQISHDLFVSFRVFVDMAAAADWVMSLLVFVFYYAVMVTLVDIWIHSWYWCYISEVIAVIQQCVVAITMTS